MKGWLNLAVAAVALFAAGATAVRAQEAPALAAIKDPAEKARVQKLIDEAKKESALSWIGVQIEPAQANSVLAEFRKYYGLPDLKGEYTYAGTGEIVTRIEQLLRANRREFDIVWTASPSWYQDLRKRNQIMKYESPFYKEYTLSNENGMSEPGYWVSDAYTFAPLYNPESIEKIGIKDFNPTSWNDFVDPRFTGKLCMLDVLVSTSAGPLLAGVVKTMGDDWLKKLGALKPALHIKSAQGREWVGSGEFAVALMNSPKDVLSLVKRNIKAKQVFPKEGLVLIPFAPIILHNAPHPATSKLFIDFVRSARGSRAITDAGALLFYGRPGVKSKHPDLLPSTEDVKVIKFDWYTEGSVAALKKFREKVRAVGIGSK